MRKSALLSLMLFIFAIITSACGSGGSSGSCEFFSFPSNAKKITLSKYKFTLDVGKTDNIIAYVNGEDKTKEVTFKPIKEEIKKYLIADVNKGIIKALKAGTSIVEVSYEGAESVTFTVTANDPTLPTLEVTKTEINLEIGADPREIEKIIVTLDGQDVTDKVSFTSTDENVATVDDNGQINIVGEGETQIIIHLDGANDQVVTVKVNLPELEINKSEINLQVGQTEQLTVKLKGEDKIADGGAVFNSSDPNIATVDENGKITAVAEGKTEITVKVDGAKEAIISVTVPHQKATLSKDNFNIMLGNSEALPNVTLRGENVNCQFESSDPNVVTIDENGNIKTVGVGETTITTTCNGDNITIPIKVYDTLTTNATNSSGQNITVNTKVLAGEEANNMKIILRDTGMIDNENAVQNVVQIDKTSDVGNVTIDIDAENGAKVGVISKNQDGTIDYVSTETVQDGKITINSVSNKNIYQVAEEDGNGNVEMVLTTAGFYKDDVLIASWEQCNSWRANWWTSGQYGATNLISSHPELIEANKLIIPEGITTLSPQAFYQAGPLVNSSVNCKLTTVVLPNSLEETDLGYVFLSGSGLELKNVNIRKDNDKYESIDGVIYSEDLKTLYLCPTNKTKMNIPNTVITIESRAFELNLCTSIGPEDSGADITIPDSVTTLKVHIFAQQTKCVWIELPSSIKNIDGLTTNSLSSSSLKSIYIPSSITNFGSVAINADNSATIYYESNGVTREQYRQIVAGYNN